MFRIGFSAAWTYDVTRHNFTGQDGLFLAVTDDSCLHGNVTTERSDDIGSLLLLVPTDNGVEHKNTDNDTEIDPVTKTSSKENSDFHSCQEVSVGSWLQRLACMVGPNDRAPVAPTPLRQLRKSKAVARKAIGSDAGMTNAAIACRW